MAVMMNPRETWTDQRLDDLNKKVEDGFGQVDKRFNRVEGDIRELRGDVKDLRGEMNARFDRMQHTLIGSAAVIVAALVGLIATQL